MQVLGYVHIGQIGFDERCHDSRGNRLLSGFWVVVFRCLWEVRGNGFVVAVMLCHNKSTYIAG